MADREARALAAGEIVEVNGTEFCVAPIAMQQLFEIQREAVRYYKRQYLQTFADNADLLGTGGKDLLERRMDKAAAWDVGDLPQKIVYNPTNVPLTDKLRARLSALYERLPEEDESLYGLLSTALDGGEISPSEVQTLTGARPRSVKSSYDMWWVTAVYDGMMTFIWASLRKNHPALTKEDIKQWPLAKIVEVARAVEKVTAPALGNT